MRPLPCVYFKSLPYTCCKPYEREEIEEFVVVLKPVALQLQAAQAHFISYSIQIIARKGISTTVFQVVSYVSSVRPSRECASPSTTSQSSEPFLVCNQRSGSRTQKVSVYQRYFVVYALCQPYREKSTLLDSHTYKQTLESTSGDAVNREKCAELPPQRSTT